MTRRFNILFTSAGRRVSLVRLFKQALNDLDLAGTVVTADLQPLSAAALVADEHELLPAVDDDAYVTAVAEICHRRQIDLLVPLIDPELLPLSQQSAEFRAMGVAPLVSSPDVNRICIDKRNTYAFFKAAGIATPEIIDPQRVFSCAADAYPVFLKPARGSSSVGATKIDDADELAFYLRHVPDAIVQEFMDGDEYTLDVLADFQGRVRCVVPRLRIETRAGETSKGTTVRNEAIIEAGRRVVEALPGPVGCITVQCFLASNGEVRFTEINPRFGGGFPLAARAGADFPRWIIELALGQRCGASFDGWEDGMTMLRYDEGIFISKHAPGEIAEGDGSGDRRGG